MTAEQEKAAVQQLAKVLEKHFGVEIQLPERWWSPPKSDGSVMKDIEKYT